MEDAVILHNGGNGIIVGLSAISDNPIFDPFDPEILYFDDGKVRRFKKNGKAYMALFDNQSDAFIGYFEEIRFWNNNKASTDKKQTTAPKGAIGSRFNLPITLTPLSDDTRVYINYKFVSREVNKFNVVVNYASKLISVNTSLTFEGLSAGNGLVANVTEINNTQLITYGNYIFDKQFLLPDDTLSPLEGGDDDLILDIIYVFNEFLQDEELISFLKEEQVYSVIEAHLGLPNRYADPSIGKDLPYHSLYNREYFARFRLQLIEFRYWLLRYKENYDSIDETDLFVYVINLFPTVELSYLSYEKKIELLEGLIIDNTWIIGDWYFNALNEERAIVKIVQSIDADSIDAITNYENINNFLDFLNTQYYNSSSRTLFEILYSKVNDAILLGDDGTGARGQLIRAILKLWTKSKYNPYRLDDTLSDQQVLDQALDNFIYTNTPAFVNKENEVGVQLVDLTAAPMLLDYESKNVLLWNINDFSFDFKENTIVASKDMVTRLEVTREGTRSREVIEEKLYGTYNILQPIALGRTELNNNNQYFIKMPFKAVEGQNLDIDNPNTDFLNNCFPIFYLKYLDDVASISNSKETLGLALDVGLTFTGVGNIPKLRHLKHGSNILAKWWYRGSLTNAERLIVSKLALQIVETGDLFISGISILFRVFTAGCTIYHNPSTGEVSPVPQKPTEGEPDYDAKLEAYEQYRYCKNVDTFLTATEIFLLVGTLRASRNVQKASSKLRAEKPSNLPIVDPEANKFIDDLIVGVRAFVDEFLERIKDTYINLYDWLKKVAEESAELASDFIYELLESNSRLFRLNIIDDTDDIVNPIYKNIDELPQASRESIKALSDFKALVKNAEVIARVERLYELIPYIARSVSNLIDPQTAFLKYGEAGLKNIEESIRVRLDLEKLNDLGEFSIPKSIRKQNVMISSMTYNGDDFISPPFSAKNFSKGEIGKFDSTVRKYIVGANEPSIFQKWFDNDVDPFLKDRIVRHVENLEKVKIRSTTNPKDFDPFTELERAAVIASHGEVRALNDLIKFLREKQVPINDGTISKILGYNRQLRGGAEKDFKDVIQPTCFHCRFITDLVKFMEN